MKKSMKSLIGFLLVIVILVLIGLCLARYSPRVGFEAVSLPPGNSEAGKEAFAQLGCANCHTVSGSDRFKAQPIHAELHVVLGGKVHQVKTYGELVTAIIHPGESIRPEYREKMAVEEGVSLMPDLTNQMTTRQLIDLVTYLQGEYDVIIPERPVNYYPYPDFPMP